jgi:hypothetical protein
MDRFTITPDAAISSVWGTLAFQTPISELDIREVTKSEAEGYERWRDGYQRNWTGGFDPIALRLSVEEKSLAADLTVMPLIDNSEYNTWVDVSRGAVLDPARNAPHPEAVLWAALSLNRESERLREFANMSVAFTQVSFLDWLGDAVTIYIDEDPVWAEFSQLADDDEMMRFMQINAHRLPVALQVNVASSIRLTAFLVALRGFIDQAAPDMTAWETRRHRDKPYVRIGSTQESRQAMPDDFSEELALYYYASSETLVFSLSEAVIHRAIDRMLDGGERSPAEDAGAAPAHPGDNMVVRIKRRAALALAALGNDQYRQHMQRLAWSALPILNEWKRLYPDRDPLEIDREIWKRVLECPGGGQYQWNEEWQTMESTVYGHPGEPQPGPDAAGILADWATGLFGLTFEQNGLRARAELRRAEENDPSGGG